MFREMRRIEKQIPKKLAENILKSNEYGTLSTLGENGYPYGLPINYVYMNSSIYVHSYKEGHKIDNIKFNPKVSFSVVDYGQVIPESFDTHYESVVVFGNSEEVYGEEKEEALEAFLHKYSKEHLKEGMKYINASKDKTSVIKINIEFMTGKKGR